jgi:hypothetical protein
MQNVALGKKNMIKQKKIYVTVHATTSLNIFFPKLRAMGK